MQLRKEELKKQGRVKVEVNEVTEEPVISAFGVTKDHMLKAASIVEAEGNINNSETLQPDYQTIMDLQTMGKVWIKITKKFSLFKWVVPKVPHSKLTWYFLLFLIQVHK